MPQADNTDTTVSEPTEAPAEVDTSTNEEAPDTDVDLEADETSFDDLEDDETEETDEDDEDEEEDTEPVESEEESKEDAEQSEPEQSDEESSDEEKEEDTSSEDQKAKNAEMAARRIAERQAKEAEKQRQQDAYLQEAEDARDLALRQLQVDAYNNRVEKNTNSLTNGLEKAVADIDLFRTGTPEVKEALAASLDKFERMYVQKDSNGDPVNVTGDVYEYLTQEADSIQRILKTGAREQSRAKEKVKTKSETLPSRAPKEPVVDPDLAEFDAEIAKLS